MQSRADVIRLRHMLEAAEEAMAFSVGKGRSDLDSNRMLRFALVRAIEIVGEAANQVSPEGRAALPDIAWASMVGMRNRIVHAYFDIDLDRVWETVTEDLPPLMDQLRRALHSGNGIR